MLTFFGVFPTHVGVFLHIAGLTYAVASLPHACGGVSSVAARSVKVARSSPRMWGCFWETGENVKALEVFPTHVGVFLTNRYISPEWYGLPHACGGVSSFTPSTSQTKASSPRMWGCFRPWASREAASPVFPTHVGVFP